MRSKLLIVVAIVAALTSCAPSFEVVLSVPSESGLQKGDAVLFEDVQIGKVAALERADERTKVTLALDPDKAKVLRRNSAAMVVSRNSSRVVEIHNSTTGSETLSSGAELLAIDSNLELMAWRAGEVLDQTNEQVGSAIESLQEYFSSPEWQQRKETVKKELTELEQAVGRSSEEVRVQLESFMNALEGKTEETARQIELQYQRLKEDFSELSNNLAKQGQEKLLPALENLTNIVREALEKYQNQQSPEESPKQST